jgi:hypothetical protein
MASKRKTLFYHLAAASLWATVLFPGSATAGPPYRTDDPEPVELHHWEFYTFTTGTHITGDTSGVGLSRALNQSCLENPPKSFFNSIDPFRTSANPSTTCA